MDSEKLENLKKVIEEIKKGEGDIFVSEGIVSPLSLEQLRKKDISFQELGDIYGFRDAEVIKNRICEDFEKTIQGLDRILEAEDHSSIGEDTAEHLKNHFIRVQLTIKSIEDFAQKIGREDSRQTDSSLKAERKHLIDIMNGSENDMKKDLDRQKMKIEIFDLKSLLKNDPSIDKRRRKIEEDLKETEELAKEAKQSASNIRDSASEMSRDQASQVFNERAKEHKKYAKIWLWSSVVSAAFLVVIILCVSFGEISHNNGMETLVFSIFRKVLLITTAGIFLKICLRKYNTERHLEVTYKHRVAALNQYGLFEAKISPENEEAKNKLRLSVANSIFNDPNTGFIEDGKNLNISPAVNLVEDTIRKGG